jgi:hypothetical protein
MGFQLPQLVTASRTPISPTSFEYTFRHSELGELGSVHFCAKHTGGCHVTQQFFRRGGDESTELRRQIFEPLAKEVVAHLNGSMKS